MYIGTCSIVYINCVHNHTVPQLKLPGWQRFIASVPAVEVVFGLQSLPALVRAQDGDQVLDGDLVTFPDVPPSLNHDPGVQKMTIF
jgi:hypothetical protein